MTDRQPAKSRWLLPAALGIVVVALVAIALLRGPVVLEPDSPEGTVQEYLVAIDEERWEDAVAVVHPDWLGGCTASDVEIFDPGDFAAELGIQSGFDGQVVRETFEVIGDDLGVQPPPGDTEVEVTITHDTGGGIGSGWNEYVAFELVDDGEFWWIVNDPWPYFIWNCRDA